MPEHAAWTTQTLEPFIDAFREAQGRAFMDRHTLAVMIEKAQAHYAAVVTRAREMSQAPPA